MWKCQCGILAYNVVKVCPLCKAKKTDELQPFDDYDTMLSDVQNWHLDKLIAVSNPELVYKLKTNTLIENNPHMTPEEELFATFFHHEKSLVKEMDDLTLRAHREELSKVAREARARIYAADDEIKERTKKVKGFKASISTDDATSDAINSIEKRRNKISKEQRFIESLAKLGISSKDAQAMLSAGNIKAHIQGKDRENAINAAKSINTAVTPEEKKPVFNPFKK